MEQKTKNFMKTKLNGKKHRHEFHLITISHNTEAQQLVSHELQNYLINYSFNCLLLLSFSLHFNCHGVIVLHYDRYHNFMFQLNWKICRFFSAWCRSVALQLVSRNFSSKKHKRPEPKRTFHWTIFITQFQLSTLYVVTFVICMCGAKIIKCGKNHLQSKNIFNNVLWIDIRVKNGYGLSALYPSASNNRISSFMELHIKKNCPRAKCTNR